MLGEFKYIGGILEWPDNVRDSGFPIFKPRPFQQQGEEEEYPTPGGKCPFFMSYAPIEPAHIIIPTNLRPPKVWENVIGCDPFDFGTKYLKKKKSKDPSKGAAINLRFLDILKRGIKNVPTMIYFDRPANPETFFENMILMCVFNQAALQVENKNKRILEYFDERGYYDWILPSSMYGDPDEKGNAPNGPGGFLEEAMTLSDSFLGVPAEGEQNNVDYIYFEILIDQLLKIDPLDTEAYDLAMAWLQAIYGRHKLLDFMIRKQKRSGTKEQANEIVGNLFGYDDDYDDED